jgi:hypothetical protein
MPSKICSTKQTLHFTGVALCISIEILLARAQDLVTAYDPAPDDTGVIETSGDPMSSTILGLNSSTHRAVSVKPILSGAFAICVVDSFR